MASTSTAAVSSFSSIVNSAAVTEFISKEFDNNMLPGLMDFVRIPNLSPGFDSEWETNGTLLQAATFMKEWVEKQGVKGCRAEIVYDKGFPPLLFVEVDATDASNQTVLFYGHYDKQPHFTGWMEGTGPTTPVVIDDNLYGRGSSDDGYCLFASILTIKACQKLGYAHPKCVITIEGEEETDSEHYMTYLEQLSSKIGTPNFVFCLDAGGSSFDTMWLTTALRGIVGAELTVEVLTEGVHSGEASGIVPSAFRILGQLLERLENSKTGVINDLFQVNMPPARYEEAVNVTNFLKEDVISKYPYHGTTQAVSKDYLQAYLNRTWRPQLSVVGAEGLPPISTAGNVLLPKNTLRLSLRTPPTLDAEKASRDLKALLEANPPYNAKVTCRIIDASTGWNAPELDANLERSAKLAARNFFSEDIQGQAEGGSIPLMLDLQSKWPQLQFIVTGVLGPFSNAHGPNERLNIPFTKKIISCMTQILADTSSNATKKE